MINIPIIIDIEASGFGKGSYPIEVGVVNEVQKTYCSLVRPAPGWTHWSDEAQAIHGISKETLNKHGKDVADIAIQLNDMLAGNIVYSDAWGNDQSWLSYLFYTANLAQRFKLESIVSLLSEQHMAKWHRTKRDVMSRLGEQRHRASNDAKIIQVTYLDVISE
ncbi:MAG: hypothetical protein GXP08_03580 [Gammaproteobacteria bacterium]|nr:hypothetical protein [Gammaproteobacteria bacterium]